MSEKASGIVGIVEAVVSLVTGGSDSAARDYATYQEASNNNRNAEINRSVDVQSSGASQTTSQSK